jgi:hypothetical protein
MRRVDAAGGNAAMRSFFFIAAEDRSEPEGAGHRIGVAARNRFLDRGALLPRVNPGFGSEFFSREATAFKIEKNASQMLTVLRKIVTRDGAEASGQVQLTSNATNIGQP